MITKEVYKSLDNIKHDEAFSIYERFNKERS